MVWCSPVKISPSVPWERPLRSGSVLHLFKNPNYEVHAITDITEKHWHFVLPLVGYENVDWFLKHVHLKIRNLILWRNSVRTMFFLRRSVLVACIHLQHNSFIAFFFIERNFVIVAYFVLENAVIFGSLFIISPAWDSTLPIFNIPSVLWLVFLMRASSLRPLHAWFLNSSKQILSNGPYFPCVLLTNSSGALACYFGDVFIVRIVYFEIFVCYRCCCGILQFLPARDGSLGSFS